MAIPRAPLIPRQRPGDTLLGMTREGLEEQLLRHHADAFGWALHCVRYDRMEAEEVLLVTAGLPLRIK